MRQNSRQGKAGESTTFIFIFARNAIPAAHCTQINSPNMTKPVHFFLIDDDADDRLLFADALMEVSAGAALDYAANCQEALSKLGSGGAALPQVIFLDLNMPRIDGKECLKHLKSDAKLKHIPVIMYTTSSQSKDIEETMLSGAVCFITKPESIAELKHILGAISESLPHNLQRALRYLSDTSTTFIVAD